MKSLSISNEFASPKECFDWAFSLEKEYHLPLTYLSLSIKTKKFDLKSNKYVKRDKPSYNVSCSLMKDNDEYDL